LIRTDRTCPSTLTPAVRNVRQSAFRSPRPLEDDSSDEVFLPSAGFSPRVLEDYPFEKTSMLLARALTFPLGSVPLLSAFNLPVLLHPSFIILEENPFQLQVDAPLPTVAQLLWLLMVDNSLQNPPNCGAKAASDLSSFPFPFFFPHSDTMNKKLLRIFLIRVPL